LVTRVFGGGDTLKAQGGATATFAAVADGPEVLPKKNRPLLNILKVNPLNRAAKADGPVRALGGGKHGLGIGKTPVRDLVNKVLGGSHKKDAGDSDGAGDSGGADEAAE
jgi:hypothetical protein